MIYEPREDSFLLQTFVRKYAQGKVLDMGTGSGVQAEAALEKTKDVLAVDINQECVVFVKQKGINAITSDLFENITGTFDCIIFNPPYLPADEREDQESAQITTGGKQGSELLERFLKGAKNYLTAKGKILIVTSSLTKNVPAILEKYNYKSNILEQEKIPFETLTVYLLEQ